MYNYNPVPQVQMQPQRAPLPQAHVTPYPKREKRILRITDPNTGRDINEETLATPGQQSGGKQSTPPQSSSGRATPVEVSHNKSWHVTLAAIAETSILVPYILVNVTQLKITQT